MTSKVAPQWHQLIAAGARARELVERTPGVIDEVQRALPPGFSGEVAVKVLSGLRTAARVLEVMPAG